MNRRNINYSLPDTWPEDCAADDALDCDYSSLIVRVHDLTLIAPELTLTNDAASKKTYDRHADVLPAGLRDHTLLSKTVGEILFPTEFRIEFLNQLARRGRVVERHLTDESRLTGKGGQGIDMTIIQQCLIAARCRLVRWVSWGRKTLPGSLRWNLLNTLAENSDLDRGLAGQHNYWALGIHIQSVAGFLAVCSRSRIWNLARRSFRDVHVQCKYPLYLDHFLRGGYSGEVRDITETVRGTGSRDGHRKAKFNIYPKINHLHRAQEPVLSINHRIRSMSMLRKLGNELSRYFDMLDSLVDRQLIQDFLGLRIEIEGPGDNLEEFATWASDGQFLKLVQDIDFENRILVEPTNYIREGRALLTWLYTYGFFTGRDDKKVTSRQQLIYNLLLMSLGFSGPRAKCWMFDSQLSQLWLPTINPLTGRNIMNREGTVHLILNLRLSFAKLLDNSRLSLVRHVPAVHGLSSLQNDFEIMRWVHEFPGRRRVGGVSYIVRRGGRFLCSFKGSHSRRNLDPKFQQAKVVAVKLAGCEFTWREDCLLHPIPLELAFTIAALPERIDQNAYELQIDQLKEEIRERDSLLDLLTVGLQREVQALEEPVQPPARPQQVEAILLDRLFLEGPPNIDRVPSILATTTLRLMLERHYANQGRMPGLRIPQLGGRGAFYSTAEVERLVLSAISLTVYTRLTPAQRNFPWNLLCESGDFSGYPERKASGLYDKFKNRASRERSEAMEVYLATMTEFQERVFAAFLTLHTQDDDVPQQLLIFGLVWDGYLQMQFVERLPFDNMQDLFQLMAPQTASRLRILEYMRNFRVFAPQVPVFLQPPPQADAVNRLIRQPPQVFDPLHALNDEDARFSDVEEAEPMSSSDSHSSVHVPSSAGDFNLNVSDGIDSGDSDVSSIEGNASNADAILNDNSDLESAYSHPEIMEPLAQDPWNVNDFMPDDEGGYSGEDSDVFMLD